MSKKFYGIFDVCYDTYGGKEDQERKKTWITVRSIQNPHDCWNDRARKVYDDRSCNEIKCALISCRQAYAYDRKFSRCHRFKTVYFIHECDEHGWWVPNKKEIEAAKILIEKNKVASSTANIMENC